MKRTIIIIVAAVAICFGNSIPKEAKAAGELRKMVTISMKQSQSLDQAIWKGVDMLLSEKPHGESGIISISTSAGDAIVVAVDLSQAEKVTSGDLPLHDFIRLYVSFQ